MSDKRKTEAKTKVSPLAIEWVEDSCFEVRVHAEPAMDEMRLPPPPPVRPSDTSPPFPPGR